MYNNRGLIIAQYMLYFSSGKRLPCTALFAGILLRYYT